MLGEVTYTFIPNSKSPLNTEIVLGWCTGGKSYLFNPVVSNLRFQMLIWMMVNISPKIVYFSFTCYHPFVHSFIHVFTQQTHRFKDLSSQEQSSLKIVKISVLYLEQNKNNTMSCYLEILMYALTHICMYSPILWWMNSFIAYF